MLIYYGKIYCICSTVSYHFACTRCVVGKCRRWAGCSLLVNNRYFACVFGNVRSIPCFFIASSMDKSRSDEFMYHRRLFTPSMRRNVTMGIRVGVVTLLLAQSCHPRTTMLDLLYSRGEETQRICEYRDNKPTKRKTMKEGSYLSTINPV